MVRIKFNFVWTQRPNVLNWRLSDFITWCRFTNSIGHACDDVISQENLCSTRPIFFGGHRCNLGDLILWMSIVKARTMVHFIYVFSSSFKGLSVIKPWIIFNRLRNIKWCLKKVEINAKQTRVDETMLIGQC